MQPHAEAGREIPLAREMVNWAALGSEAQGVWSVFMQAPTPLCILEGPQHRVTFANAAYRALVGGRELLGRPYPDALPGPQDRVLLALVTQVAATGEARVAKAVLVNPLGGREGQPEPAFYNFVCSPKRSPQGVIDGLFLSASEVTDQVLARQRSAALSEQLRASAEHLQRVVSASGTGAWELDLVTGRVSADARLRELHGLSQQQQLSLMSSLEMIHEEDRQPVSDAIASAFDRSSSGLFIVEYRRAQVRDGERWIESRGQVLRDPSGEAVRLVGTSVDITMRKAAEARQAKHGAIRSQLGLALAHSATERQMLEQCVEALASHLDVPLARIWLLNPKDNVLELQASAGPYTHLGADHGRIPIGEFQIGLLVKDQEPEQELAAGGAEPPWSGHLLWALSEGITAFAGLPLLLGDMLVGIIGLYCHQPPHHETMELLRQLTGSIALGVKRLRAESELRARADFEKHLLGIVSHDLRNPLNAILLSATALARWESLDALAAKTVLRIQSSAERAARMIRDLLDFTQARLGGGIRITRRPVDLHEIIRSVLDEVEAAHPGRELRTRLDGDGHGEWDSDRIAQVVQNVVTNALKYSPQDTVVQIVTSTDRSWVSFSVHNRGAPIPTERMPSLFEPLLRGTAEVDRTGRSIGLGLYIVKQIAEAHGGRVLVRSNESEGTIFTILLPR